MTPSGCTEFEYDLGPFVDGELDGARMLRMSRHLEDCAECARAMADLQRLGRALRRAGAIEPPLETFAGLAASVVSRTRAESNESWRSRLTRGCADWHWAIVGAGSVAATFVSTSLLSVVLAFGPAPQRDDSLSALMTDLGSSSGFLFVYASPTGAAAGREVRMLQVENGRPAAPPLVSDLVVSRSYQSAPETELVNHLRQVITRDGRIVDLEDLGPQQRQAAEALLDEIRRLRSSPRSPVGRSYNVHEMRLVTSTGVSAKYYPPL